MAVEARGGIREPADPETGGLPGPGGGAPTHETPISFASTPMVPSWPLTMDATAAELIARLRQSPEDAYSYAALKAHYHELGDHASLANLVEGWARRHADPGEAAKAFHEAARIVSYYLSDQERAAALLAESLERDPTSQEVADDPACVAALRHYRSLMPMAQEARKPMFFLRPADGAIGGHAAAVQECYKDFHNLAWRIAQRCAIDLPPPF